MEGKFVQLYNKNTSSFPESYATFLSNITLTTTELHDVKYIQKHDYWQFRMPSVPICAPRNPRIHEKSLL